MPEGHCIKEGKLFQIESITLTQSICIESIEKSVFLFIFYTN